MKNNTAHHRENKNGRADQTETIPYGADRSTSASKPLRVLVVEDSPIVRERIVALIGEVEAIEIVAQAEDGDQAQQLFRQHRPDAVVLDIQLPGISGLDLLVQFKQEHPDCMVMVLTTYGVPAFRQRSIALGADYFFDKSTEFERVAEVLGAMQASARVVTERKLMEKQQKLAMQVLATLNRENDVTLLVKDILLLIKEQMGFEAVGIRLHESDDFPYYETSGFSGRFVEAERYLCERDAAGEPVRDADGSPALECMCGNVLCGRFDSAKPFFTEAGSFWTSSTSELLCATTEQDRQSRTRNRCNSEGYESVALIPLRAGDEVIGLLQFNDHRKGLFTLNMIQFFEGLSASIGIAVARKQAAEEIRSVAKFASENPNPVLRVGEDGTLLYANKAAQMLQSSLQATEGVAVSTEWMEYIRQTVEIGRPVEMEINIARQIFAVNFVPIINNGYVNVYARDITESKQTEAEKERFLTAIDQVAETIVITDTAGTIQYVNPAFEMGSGYTREEAMGKKLRMLQSGEHDNTFYQQMWNTLLRGETWSGRMVNKKKDGTLYTVEATISPVKDAAGKIVNYVAVKRDITIELVREEQYRQIQKMESVGLLAGGIAHDFNNILQTITGFCEILTMRMDRVIASCPKEASVYVSHRADVEEIHKAALHAADLTRQLLIFSRKQQTELREIDLNAVLVDDMRMLSKASTDYVKLVCEFPPELPTIYADSSQMMQIMLNLVVNAGDAMPNGGVVSIATEAIRIGPDDVQRIARSRPGEFICLSVSDTGIGMDTNQLERMFEPFYTTKQPDKGTGLGLAVVYGIVQNHHGWINVSTTVGSGTTFRIYLPVYAGHGVDAQSSLPDGEIVPGRILLVEDDSFVRDLTGEALQGMGYAVFSAETAQEAEELFAAENGAFDLLLFDVMLPDGNGIELAETFLERMPGLPILLSGGHSDERVETGLIAKRGFDHMTKPYSLKTLLDAVGKSLQRT